MILMTWGGFLAVFVSRNGSTPYLPTLIILAGEPNQGRGLSFTAEERCSTVVGYLGSL